MNSRHTSTISLLAAITLWTACGESADDMPAADKGGEDFVLGDVATGKGDTQLELLSEKDSARIERSLASYKARKALLLEQVTTIRDTKDLGDDAKKGLVAALDAFAKIFA